MTRALIGLAAAFFLAVLFMAAAPPEPRGFELKGDVERGEAAFAKRCALCHGATGDGKGTLKTDPPARDFRTPGLLASRSDWEIYVVIRDGGTALGLSPKMLGWQKILTDQEIRDTAAFVRTLARPGK